LVSQFSVPPLQQYDFLSLFTRSKNREEIELQQGTPDVQKNLQTGNIQQMK
jgi:hypothetical protein